MNKAWGAALLCAAIAGCANTSGVVSTGANSYTITTSASPGRGGVPYAKRMAYEEAVKACAAAGRSQVVATSEQSSPPTWTEGMAIVELNFRCE